MKYLPDVLMVAGGACLSYGASLAWQPAGWIIAGLLTLAAGVLLARTA